MRRQSGTSRNILCSSRAGSTLGLRATMSGGFGRSTRLRVMGSPVVGAASFPFHKTAQGETNLIGNSTARDLRREICLRRLPRPYFSHSSARISIGGGGGSDVGHRPVAPVVGEDVRDVGLRLG